MLDYSAKATFGEIDFSKQIYLLVDDERFSRSLIKTTLAQMGGRDIIEVSSAAEAIEVLKNQKTNIILLDHLMPDMLGLELCRKLRAGEFNDINQNTPVILISGDVRMETVIEAKESQINAFLVKPISFDKLQKRLIKVLSEGKDDESLNPQPSETKE